ncbi:MAG: tRNA lysidine(34) synthetase TilS [Inquilinus sp.]|nr:tRNA lysidine(34) synthetase TilS [Inquilinus sp.]
MPDPTVADTFAAALDAGGPFEPGPRLAVAVSGGADSMALCLLADRWARDRGGSVLALTVDHRLRPDSATEAVDLGRRLERRGIAHRTLVWRHGPVTAAVQATARDARYRLLEAACVEAGILHLLIAHTLEDQAETVLLRLAKGSGVDGLAGMASMRETAAVRLLRPLLAVPKGALTAVCAAAGLEWFEDPSNRDDRFARARLRRLVPLLAGEGLTAGRLADTARRAGRARAALDRAAARLLAEAAAILPEGYIVLDGAALAAEPREVALRALSSCLTAVGVGGGYPPRLERLERLLAAVLDGGLGGGRTLAGCRVQPRKKSGRLLICREPAAAKELLAIDPAALRAPHQPLLWDRRFRLRLPRLNGIDRPLTVRRLGTAGRIAAKAADALKPGLPAVVAAALPGLWQGDTLIAAPKFVASAEARELCKMPLCDVTYAPVRPVVPPGFAVA